MSEEILINVTPRETRVALIENGMLQEIGIERAVAPEGVARHRLAVGALVVQKIGSVLEIEVSPVAGPSLVEAVIESVAPDCGPLRTRCDVSETKRDAAGHGHHGDFIRPGGIDRRP